MYPPKNTRKSDKYTHDVPIDTYCWLSPPATNSHERLARLNDQISVRPLPLKEFLKINTFRLNYPPNRITLLLERKQWGEERSQGRLKYSMLQLVNR